VTPNETLGNFIYNLGNGQWDTLRKHAVQQNFRYVMVISGFSKSQNRKYIGIKDGVNKEGRTNFEPAFPYS
jgi:hypothetical protein